MCSLTWEDLRFDEQGRAYYIDHSTKTSSWDPPPPPPPPPPVAEGLSGNTLRYASILIGLFCHRTMSLLAYYRSLLTLTNTSGTLSRCRASVVCVCVCVCIHIHTHMHMHIHLHMHIHTHTHDTCIHIHIHTYTYTYTYIHIHIHIHIHTHIHTHMHMHTHIHTILNIQPSIPSRMKILCFVLKHLCFVLTNVCFVLHILRLVNHTISEHPLTNDRFSLQQSTSNSQSTSQPQIFALAHRLSNKVRTIGKGLGIAHAHLYFLTAPQVFTPKIAK